MASEGNGLTARMDIMERNQSEIFRRQRESEELLARIDERQITNQKSTDRQFEELTARFDEWDASVKEAASNRAKLSVSTRNVVLAGIISIIVAAISAYAVIHTGAHP
jgi:hypothetical protein